jgi:hypothetical protein
MRATFPKSHEFGGMLIERGRFCVCGERYFPQFVVTSDYLAAVGDAFLANCEVIAKGDRRVAWFPKRCHHCLRRM